MKMELCILLLVCSLKKCLNCAPSFLFYWFAHICIIALSGF